MLEQGQGHDDVGTRAGGVKTKARGVMMWRFECCGTKAGGAITCWNEGRGRENVLE